MKLFAQYVATASKKGVKLPRLPHETTVPAFQGELTLNLLCSNLKLTNVINVAVVCSCPVV